MPCNSRASLERESPDNPKGFDPHFGEHGANTLSSADCKQSLKFSTEEASKFLNSISILKKLVQAFFSSGDFKIHLNKLTSEEHPNCEAYCVQNFNGVTFQQTDEWIAIAGARFQNLIHFFIFSQL
jgi:hypothetical protein